MRTIIKVVKAIVINVTLVAVSLFIGFAMNYTVALIVATLGIV